MKFCFFLVAVCACAVAGARGDRLVGEYSIPAEPALASQASYQMEFKLEGASGARNIEYDLPVELDGLGQEINLSEISPGIFEGPLGRAICTNIKAFECHIFYRNLNFDPVQANSFVDAKYTDLNVAGIQKRLGKQFRMDPEPGGVFKVRSSP